MPLTPMILHYIKIALRNIAKYKTQNFISIVSVAVAVMFFTGVWSVVERSIPVNHWDEDPDYERIYKVRSYNSVTLAQTALYDTTYLTCAKKILPDPDNDYHAYIGYFFLESDSQYLYPNEFAAKISNAEYMAGSHAYSAVSGKAVSPLDEGTVILSKDIALKTFGTTDVIGKRIKLRRWHHTIEDNKISAVAENEISTFVIADVKQDDEWQLSRPSSLNIYIPGANYTLCRSSYVTLKEGFTQRDLRSQLDNLFPSLKFTIEPISTRLGVIKYQIIALRGFLYSLCALILLGALIGFLRMQIQLFGLRHREIALRTVLGGTTGNLWILLITEVGIVLMLTAFLTGMLVMLLKDYLHASIGTFLNHFIWTMNDFGEKATWLFAIVAFVTLITVSVSLLFVKARQNGLSLQMRPNRSHIGRNVSIGFQMVLSTLLVSVCLFFADIQALMLEDFGIVSKDRLDRCFSVPNLIGGSDIQLSMQEKALDESEYVERFTRYDIAYSDLYPHETDLQKKGSICTFLQGQNGELEQIFDLQVTPLVTEQLPPETPTALVSESLYGKILSDSTLSMNELRILDNTPRRIVGTYKTMPYSSKKDFSAILTADLSDLSTYRPRLLVLAKPNHVDETVKLLTKSVPQEVQRFVNSGIERAQIKKYGDDSKSFIDLIGMAYSLATLLTFVSIVSSGASLYSTVQLDTRRRQKEVAMRKINGATQKNIALLFAKKYVIITLICFVICIPLCIFFSMAFIPNGNEISTPHLIKFLSFTTLGITAVTALTIGFHIRRIMRINPAEIIKNE